MIATRSLTKVYLSGWYRRRMTEAVRSLDLSVERGEIFGLLGPNGAGKTTTVKMICGLVQPTSGSVLLDGHRVGGHSKWPSRLTGAVLEGSRNVYWNLTSWENLLYFARLRGVGDAMAKARAEELLGEFALREKTRDAVGTLSRGMQQKLAVCCALVSDPPILLVDEPTLGLDVASARAIREKLRHLAREEKRTILLTTHNMQLAASVCDRVGIIDKGVLVRTGTVSDFVDVLEASSYVIECAGKLNEETRRKLDRIPALQLSGENASTEIRLPVGSEGPRAAALYEVIDILREGNFQLVSIREAKRSLEDAFVQLTEEPTNAVSG